MDAALPPACDGDVDAGKTLHTRTIEDEERCAMDTAPLPSYNGDDAADKTARSRTTRARVFLAMGLAVEVCTTLWAFQQAVSAGALNGDVNCGYDGRLAKLYGSSLVVEKCDGQIDTDVFYNFSNTLTERYSSYHWEEYVGCDSLTEAPTARDDFSKLCRCDSPYDRQWGQPCSWVAVSSPADDICYAQSVFTSSSNGDINGTVSGYSNCWPTNPTGSVRLTISSLVVALSSQLLEAFVCFKYWKDAEPRTAPTLAASVFDALGVLTVSSVLLSLPGLYTVSDDTPNRLTVFVWMAWTVVTIVIVGALAEIMAECSDCGAGRLSYLGAVGNGIIWFGAALLEVLVPLYLLCVGNPWMPLAEIAHEIGAFIALELFGLVAMWIARGLWTSAKLLRSSVKSLDRRLRKRAINTLFR